MWLHTSLFLACTSMTFRTSSQTGVVQIPIGVVYLKNMFRKIATSMNAQTKMFDFLHVVYFSRKHLAGLCILFFPFDTTHHLWRPLASNCMLSQLMRLPDFDQKKTKVMFKDVECEDRANLWLSRSQTDAAEKDIWNISSLDMI